MSLSDVYIYIYRQYGCQPYIVIGLDYVIEREREREIYIDSTDVSLFPAPPFRHHGGALVSGLGTCMLASWPGRDLDLQKRKRDSIHVQETMRAQVCSTPHVTPYKQHMPSS